MTEKFPYEDIINLPPHISAKYPQPTMEERAARYGPFAVINGYEEMVLEEARTTEERIELDEGAKAVLNEKLNILQKFYMRHPEVTVTYYESDQKKSGGAYISRTGLLKRIDLYQHMLILESKQQIPLGDIYALESRLFEELGMEY